MSDDAPQAQPAADDRDDLASSDVDPALIPHEEHEGPADMSANRAKADADPGTQPDAADEGDKNTDPNAQPPA